ncbi:protein trichome birefringence-like 35 [Nymphaea colorata]|uniref:protein trichome birefringence-like 35 n=1 Tax=Nymphaea colorata TaxID=210225 RepID=UPI00129E7498|nr:protein trichome birefringence-like 35 [Nymphaea colorata]
MHTVKGRPPIPVFAVFVCVFFVGFFLYNENIRRIQEDKAGRLRESLSSAVSTPDRGRSRTENRSSTSSGGAFDWSKACPTIRNRSLGAEGKRSGLETRGDDFTDEFADQRPEDSNTCDLFSGKWVFDNASYPLYSERDCPYMSDQLACRKHGRPDSVYQNWRWQPHKCNLKRWNATAMWEKLRGKRLVFVGDSLNRGQWISMVCLLQSVIPKDQKYMTPNSHLTIFKAKEYNASVEFYWAPLLVESNSDDPVKHRLSNRIIRPDSIAKHAAHWGKADILVFNSYLWWRSGTKIKLLWENAEDGACEETEGLEAMKLALRTWEEWIFSNINPLLTRVFFVTMSPTHLWSHEWGPKTGGNCFNETTPITTEYYWGSGSDTRIMRIVDNILARLGSRVTVLNITQLSEYRKDGHPSIYRKFWETFSSEQMLNPVSRSDCIHWCLPGVPDAWNELLYALL